MKKWIFVSGIIIVILLIFGMIYYTITISKSNLEIEIKNPIQNTNSKEAILQFNESYITYLVFAIGGWKLHNPPLSSDTPKIKVIVDDAVFVSEIIDSSIVTEEKDTNKEDIIIKTSKQEIINAILSLDIKDYIQQSVQEGKTSFVFKASKTKLFSKGYLSLYKDITGKSFIGAVIKMFG